RRDRAAVGPLLGLHVRRAGRCRPGPGRAHRATPRLVQHDDGADGVTAAMETFVRLARSRITTGVIWLLIGLAIPLVIDTDAFRIGQFNYIVSVVMVSIGLNLVLGYAGQLFLGPGAMFAGGAYAAAYMAVNYESFQ